jgi:hypothetical protein
VNALSIVLIVACIGTFGLGFAARSAIPDIRRMGKIRVVWWDPDGGVFNITWEKRVPGKNEIAKKKPNGASYILEARARQPGPWPTWVLHPRHGWNYMPLTDAETVEKDALLQRLAISNPASYHNAISINKPRQGFRSNDPDDKWGWVMPVAIVAGCLLALILLGVMFLVFGSQGGGTAAAATAAAGGG